MSRHLDTFDQGDRPIGVFDSGVGGLTILREVRKALPREDLIYVADSAHVPYGGKPREAIRARARALTGFLVAQGAKAIVVACNTATAAAIDALRNEFPLPIIGVEPAVKPAVAATRSGVIGVLATPALLESERYASLVHRHGAKVRVLAQPCAGLAEHIERGDLDGEQTEALLRRFVDPLLAAGADAIVLGCTHYPLVAHLVSRISGREVAVIENGTAVARELSRQLESRGCRRRTGSGSQSFWASGSTQEMHALLARLGEPGVEVRMLPAAAD
jgi:glutamate racemase